MTSRTSEGITTALSEIKTTVDDAHLASEELEEVVPEATSEM